MKLFFKPTLLVLLILGATQLNSAQIKKTASVEGITEYALDNGMKVLLFPDNSSQTITVNVTYLVGSRHEGYGEKGMAHLLEHLVFKGTPSHEDIPNELTERGARANGTTWYDRTNYYETFNATDDNLEWALDLESDRMMNSYISKEDLDSEFSVVRNEFESGENSPSRTLSQKVIRAAYMWHNYGNSTIGNRSDIERVPIANLKAFYKKYYRPDNAVLMITGKFDNKRTLELVDKYFGPLNNPSTILNEVPTVEPAQDGEKRVELNRVGDLQLLMALYHSPAGSDADYSALTLVQNVLNDAPSGRLYKALVETQMASNVYASNPFTKDPGFINFNVSVPSEKSLADAEKTLLSVLDGLKDNPITSEELKRARANVMKQLDQLSRNSGYMATYMSEFIGAGDWRLAFIHRDRVESTTVEEVNAAVQKYFIPTNRTIGNFIPTDKPERVEILHPEGVAEMVASYKGKVAMDVGEDFDVDYDNIQNRLDSGILPKSGIEYGFINKANRGETVTLSFAIRSGNVDDYMNKGVTAGFVASLLNKGTQSRSRQDIEDALSAISSSVGFSGRNGLVYASISSTKEHLPSALEIMTDMLKNPKFEISELDKIKTQRLAGLESSASDPQFLAVQRMRQINQVHSKGHPNYFPNIDEQIAMIKDVSIERIQSFYDNYYGISDNASLVVIGSMDVDMVKTYFEDNFSDFKSDKPFSEIKNPYKQNVAANENIITPDKKNAFTIGMLSAKTTEVDKDNAALQIAGTIFGGGFLNSRVATRLRQQDGISYGAGAQVSIDSDPDDKNSNLIIYAIYAPMNAEKVQIGFKEELERFIVDGITQEELDSALNGWVQGQTVSRAKDNELSSLINNNLYFDRDMSFQAALESQVSALTVEKVNAVIKKYFKSLDQWTVVNGGDFQ
ncbi:MAG: M16 family metallopeptidase [Flavobacteriales bacterium]